MNTKLLYFFLITVNLHLTSLGQGFNKVYNYTTADLWSTVLINNSGYYLAGSTFPISLDTGYALLSSLDSAGKEKQTYLLGNKGHSVYNMKLRPYLNTYLAIYSDRDSASAKRRIFLCSLDSTFQIVSQKDTTFSDSFNCVPTNWCVTRDSGFYVIGFMSDSCPGCVPFSWIAKFDKHFQPVFFNRFLYYYRTDFYDLVVDMDDNLYLAGSLEYSAGSYKQALVVKLDSRGNTLWRKVYGSSYDDYASRLCMISHNRIAVGGIAYFGNSWEEGRSRISIIDSNGATIRDKIYTPDSAISLEYIKIICPSADSLIACSYPSCNSGVQDTFFLMSIDTNLNVHWYVPVAPSITHHTEIYDFQLTPDKGYIFCGSSNYGTQDAWLVKMDSNLCANEWCWHTTGMPSIEAELSQLKVYPNPADDYLTLAFDFKELEDVLYSILDLQGRVLLKEDVKSPGNAKEQDISLHALSAGMYILKVEFKNQSFSRKFVKR